MSLPRASASILRPALLLAIASAALPLHAATFTVNSNSDSGAATNCGGGGTCTLRAALLAANATPTQDTILFDLPAGAVIAPLSAFPVVTAPVLIDARPNPTHTGRPTVFVDGAAAGASADGLRLGNGAAGSSVYGLGIAGFGGAGIELSGNAHVVTIRGCELGYRSTGILAGNGIGIYVGTDSNSIGQAYVVGTGFILDGNTIVASDGDGIAIIGDGNLVYGNRIGAATAESGNNVGIRIFNGNGNIIGGMAGGDTSGNRILSSTSHGVVISGNNNAVRANRIGVSEGGDLSPNGGAGIVVAGAGNLIGGAQADARNYIEGNATGIQVGDVGAGLDTQIIGNQVARNRGTGIRVILGTGNLIDDNSIQGNGTGGVGDGIRLDSDDNTVSRNRIGTGTGHTGEGVFLSGPANNNTIGDNEIRGNRNGIKIEGSGNAVIANGTRGNDGFGVWLRPTASNSEVRNNNMVENGSYGIIVESGNNTVHANGIAGNEAAGARLLGTANTLDSNILVGNGDGVIDSGTGNRIHSNVIGLYPDNTALGNTRHGIWTFSEASGTRIEGNRIAFNGAHGMLLEGDLPQVQGNEVGSYLLENFTYAAVGNGGDGIRLFRSSGAVIDEGNIIGSNGADGVAIDLSSDVLLAGNAIVANHLSGVALLEDAGAVLVEDNQIFANGSNGIHVGPNAGVHNRFRSNVMALNGLAGGMPGIDLGGDGPSINDPGDADEGANRMQNAPVLLFNAPVGESGLEVGYSVDTSPGNAAYPLQIEVYGAFAGDDPSQPAREGAAPLGFGTYSAPGVASVTVARPDLDAVWLLATVTDADGNTSEFSDAIMWVGAGPRPVAIFRSGFESEAPPSAAGVLRAPAR